MPRKPNRPTVWGAAVPALPAGEYLHELDRVCRGIRDPVDKLRYLRKSLANKPRLLDRLDSVPGTPIRRALYRWASLEQMRRSVHASTLDAGARRSLFLARGMGILAAGSVLAAVAGVATTAFQAGAKIPAPIAVAADSGGGRPALPPVAEPLPNLPAVVTPKAVWLVEQGPAYEQYSNGLRIDTRFTTVDSPKRHYRTFLKDGGMEEEARDTPAGIMFHTTESDIWPLEASFNEKLRDGSERLLRYLRREHVYHFLIDRFGRVYRVVGEDAKANHAGIGAWNEADRFYLSLNNAFLGVSFETRWEAGRALPITEAQLVSGRGLTDYLRRRYDIPPEMCVAHGLTSLNWQKHIIGHHLDWARGFPFEAFGLPDQYLRPPTNVVFFGFGYDRSLTDRMGEPWPGVPAGAAAFEAEAKNAGISPEALRKQREDLYDKWQSEQIRDEEAARAGPNRSKARASASGG